jgi:hypothetical protein
MATEFIMLFVEGQPVIYEVEKKQNCFSFTPLTSWKDQFEATGFILQKVRGHWEVIGAPDKNTIDQAIEEVENNLFEDTPK